MVLRFERWNVDDGHEAVPVLRLRLDDTLLSDPGRADCFGSAVAAAEAAHLLFGGEPEGPTWKQQAELSFMEPAVADLPLADVRIIGPAQMDEDQVHWLKRSPGASLAEESATALDPLAEFLSSRPLEPLGEEDEPLSGRSTRDWQLIDVAAAVAAGKTPLTED